MNGFGSRCCRLLALSLAVASLTACGGGGGATGGGITTPPPPVVTPPVVTPPVVTPPAPVIISPSTSSTEYRRNPGLALIKPEAAWTQGATGAGIVVAVIDGGVKTTQTDLAGRLTTADIIAGRTTEPSSEHATSVAGVIASAFNDVYTVGVAYEAEILSIRSDQAGSCDTTCNYTSRDLAAAIDYARSHGARVINMSLGSDTSSGRDVTDALQRAVNAGVVIVASAGNDGAADPSYPARYAVDSRFAGAMIAAGALNSSGSALAGFSNRAGVGMEGYLAAPGENIRTNCQTTSGGAVACNVVSGTSFSAPHVAGALALLLDGFPNISGRDAVDILLRSARDMGASGTDVVFGRGALDIERAFQPIGAVSTPASVGSFVIESVGGGATAGAAFGDAWRAADLGTVGYDEYERLFQINLGNGWRSAGRPNPLPSAAPAAQRSSVVQTLEGGATLRFSAITGAPDRVSSLGSDLTARRGQESSAVTLSDGALRLDLWNGRGGAVPTFDDAPADAFVALAQAGEAARASVALGRWTLSAEGGSGLIDRLAHLDLLAEPAASRDTASRYRRVVASFSGDQWSVAVGTGALAEPSGALGSFATTTSGFGMAARSRFTSLDAAWRPVEWASLTVQAGDGRTEAKGALLSIRDARSSNWAVNADLSCARFGLSACSGLTLSVNQPLRVRSGQAFALLADVPAGYFDLLTYSQRTVDLSPTSRQIDLGLGLWRPVWDGVARVQAVAQFHPGHSAYAPVAYGMTASFRAPF